MTGLEAFDPVSLGDMAAHTSMMERIDNKYIVSLSTLEGLLAELRDNFVALEIGGARKFTYETCYFDSLDHQSYFDHLRGRRKRSKVRIRRYVDAEECFLELKIKDKRGRTVKKRLPHDLACPDKINQSDLEHIHAAYEDAYGRAFPYELEPSLLIGYQRMSLVSKFRQERLTIDGAIIFTEGSQSHRLNADSYIIETKSVKGNGLADKILRRAHQHPTAHCSKYCVGMSLLNAELKNNAFQPALRKLAGEALPSFFSP